MPVIRQASFRHFRGFEDFTTHLPAHAVLVGEPGAGRSDLVEGLIRVLDGDYWRSRRGDQLDFYDLDTSVPAEVELTIGELSKAAQDALEYNVEYWDKEDGLVIEEFADPSQMDEERHEPVLRLTYRLSEGDDGRLDEIVYWAKSGADNPQAVRSASREHIPFLWQRGWSSRPLDLSGRGDLRELIDAQAGAPFDEAIEAFVAAVGDAAKVFSEHERVGTALDELMTGLRPLRRFDPEARASDVLRFMPDGGASSGLLRSLAAAATLKDGPALLPVARHGSSVSAALRGSLLLAGARQQPGAIVVIDELSSDLDPSLAGYIARQLRHDAGQLIMTTHVPGVASVFETDEIVRLHWKNGSRAVAIGRRPVSKPDRIAQRYFGYQILPALSASAVVVCEGPGDRIAIDALIQKTTGMASIPSLDAASIEVIEANGCGEVVKVVEQARALGIYTIALFDDDNPAGAPNSPEVTATLPVADVVLRLPPQTAIERLLLVGVPDAEIVRVVSALPKQPARTDWETLTGAALVETVRVLLHDEKGPLHASFVREIDLTLLSANSLKLLPRIHSLATKRTETGLVGLDEPATTH
jgi:putative ATP-dependent endonuclease of OLD family